MGVPFVPIITFLSATYATPTTSRAEDKGPPSIHNDSNFGQSIFFS